MSVKEDYISLLKEIFHSSDKDSSIISPIVDNSDNIYKLKLFMENKKNDNTNKINLLKKLEELFLLNNNLIPFIVTRINSNSFNFSFPIIKLYVSDDTNEETLLFLEKFLYLLNSNVSISSLSLEFIYQKFSECFRNKGKKKLTESRFIHYLQLLKIFYKDPSSGKNNENNKKDTPSDSSQTKEKQINNYIYLNGYGSKLSFSSNKNNSTFPNLENGCSFFFWINLDENLLQIYSKLYPNVEISLITITIQKNSIKVILKDAKILKVVIDKNESNHIAFPTIFQFNKWNNIGLIINEKNSIKLYINRVNCTTSTIPKDFPINKKIESIECFNNLIGKISSLLFLSFPLEQNQINDLDSQLKYGFYKNKILFRFLYSIDNNYFNNTYYYSYIEKFKNEKNDISFKILSKENIEKNAISLFCPFAYNKNNKNENIIDDIFGNYIGNLGKNDGANYFTNYTKDIKQVGGMHCLLPIAEIIYSSTLMNKRNPYDLIDKDILSEKSFAEFLNIIRILLVNHRKNLDNANKNDFFSSLGMFLEKIPSKNYTEKVLDILLEIGNEVFVAEFDKKNPKNNNNYIYMILLNEKIFSKFSEENQRKLWEDINKFFTENYSRMKDSLNISKICLLLRFYDEKRYDEYCCIEHAKLFEKLKNNQLSLDKEDIRVMNPQMGDKINKLFDIIQIYIDKLEIDDESINIYKLLILDISPCLQKEIIQVYIKHFSNNEISQEKKKNTVNNLLKNDYIEITEYALSISLLDIRIQILKLFKVIISDYNEIFMDKIKASNINLEDVLNFIRDNLLPNKLLVETDCLKSKDDKDKESIKNYYIDDNDNLDNNIRKANTETEINIKSDNFRVLSEKSMILTNSAYLVKYINKDIYDDQINSLFNFLVNDWLTKYIEKEKKINAFIIDFCIWLVCELSPDYLNSFSNILTIGFENNDIEKEKLLLQNKNIFPWLIETIFLFNDSENIKKYDKDKITELQTQTINLFTKIICLEKPIIELQTKIKYILDYSYYLLYIHQNYKEKKNEIARITRILLSKLSGCPSDYINLIAQNCFEFMIFYKNSEKLFNIDYNTNKEEIRDTINLINDSSKSEIKDNEQKLNDNIINDEKLNEINNDNNKILITLQ